MRFTTLPAPHFRPLCLLLVTWGTYFAVLFQNLLKWRPDGLYGGHVNVWSDWSLHIGMASIFAFKSPQHWFTYHPVFSEGPLNYPFLSNLISGLILKSGLSFYWAFIVPSMVLMFFLILGIYFLFYQISGKRSILPVFIFFLSSGLGFVDFFRDFYSSGNWDLLFYPREYSSLTDHDWFSGNVIVGMLIPQRAFLLGLTLSVCSINGYLWVFRKDSLQTQVSRGVLIISGLMAGTVILCHVHSFLCLIIIMGLLASSQYKQWHKILYYCIPAGLVSIISYYLYYAGGVTTKNFLVWLPGWTAHGILDWFRQWFIQWGPVLPLSIATLVIYWSKWTLQRRAFFCSFFILFILANLIRFQPLNWDNSKIFLWVYLGFSGLMSHIILVLFRGRTRFLSILIAMTLTLTGFLELIRLQRTDKNSYRMISREEISLGEEVRKNTDPLAVVLTATSHNHWVMMWALRPVVMGYSAWVMNFGFPWSETENDVKKMFGGESSLLKKYQVSYVVIGPTERRSFPINYSFFSRFPQAFQGAKTLVYDIRKLTGQN